MRHYQIYLIEDDVAETFFGEESKLFHLFLEANLVKSSSKCRMLQKQIDYITKPIPATAVENEIKSALGLQSGYVSLDGNHFLKVPEPESRAELKISEGRMVMKSFGAKLAETIFFEVLRQSERCWLAMDFYEHCYGWLKPVKQKRII